ncbi:hypothetical protein BGZ63DRAFT_421482 [Mariannaea sp. PMI_226]|nr:hypothetical protein BGZ63DRAFT_421482 [Mariannaea sp. PMI_226]
MASSLAADKPSLPAPSAAMNDPFVTSTPAPARNRYSNFDQDLFIAGPASSPGQARRVLEAHLTETERRLEEASKLGTALVSQRKALTEQLQEVEKLQAEGELNPELRQKLVDIEKEYHNLARESARAFLPKQRVPSNEVNPNSPFAPETRSGRRSVSPSKFESQATGSPTKLSVPNRKIRNQPSNRVHDIEFAAEISTSLIAQVRNLQALLAERDEEVKDLKESNSQLDRESESLKQRAKTLDESENRYKEENWNLETKLQELTAQQKEASDREKKLIQSLNVITTEKVTAQRELDETKVTHARLIDEYAAAVRNHDIELGSAKRKIGMAEGERAAMQRRIDDLTGQNQELARAFSTQRARVASMESAPRASDDDFESAGDHITPDHSPPQSPIKGTPRHAVLETETMKSSLHHAQRTIQSQRSLLHREKTEKLELRRIIQDLRDDLEKARNDTAESKPHRRSKKKDSKEFRKPPTLLGSFRSSKHEVIPDDQEWEDQGDISPLHSSSPMTASTITVRKQTSGVSLLPTDASEQFDTANEASESAFETANERATATETEDFQTVNEDFSGSDDALTETESPSRGFGKMQKPPNLPSALARHASRHSINSTASTSADEDDYTHVRTPTGTISSQRSSRFRLSRNIFTRSRQASEEPVLQSSPMSFASSNQGTPLGGQSLFAELQEFGSDDESIGAHSPSRRGRSVTPGSVGTPFSPPPPMPALPKVVMVDSGVMTEPVNIVSARDGLDTLHVPRSMLGGRDDSIPGSPVSVVPADRPKSISTVDDSSEGVALSWTLEDPVDGSRPVSRSYNDAGAQHDPGMEEKLPLPPSPALGISLIASENIEPREEVVVPPALSIVPISNQSFEPVAEPDIPLPDLRITGIISEILEPVAEPEIPAPELRLTSIITEDVEPVAEPEIPPPDLSLTTIIAEDLEPVAEPEIPPSTLSLTSIIAENLEPVAEPEILPNLSMTSILVQDLEPVAEPDVPPPNLSLSAVVGEGVEPIAVPIPDLSLSTIIREQVEPVAELEAPPPTLSLTMLSVEELTPLAEPEIPSPVLSLTAVIAEQVDPVAEPEPALPELSLVSITVEELEPVAEPQTPAPVLSLTSVLAESVDPIEMPEVLAPELTFSSICGEGVEPVAEPEILPIVVAPPPPSLSISVIQHEHIEPIVLEAPELSMSEIVGEHVEPLATPVAALSLSALLHEHIHPIAEPEPTPILPPALSLSSIFQEHVQPITEPEPEPVLPPKPDLSLSTIMSECVDPIKEPDVPTPLPQLSISTIFGEHVEPILEPETPAPPKPQLTISAIFGEGVEPLAEPEPLLPQLTLSTLVAQNVDPIAEPEPEPVVPVMPELTLSSILREHIEPGRLEVPELGMSAIAAQAVEPIAEPEKVIPPPTLNISQIHTEQCEPKELPPVELAYSVLSTEQVAPISEPEPLPPTLALSSILTENVKPILEPLAPPPALVLSSIAAQGVEPIVPVHKVPSLPAFGFSSISSVETQPVIARSPYRDGFILPRDMKSPFMEQDFPETLPETPTSKIFGRRQRDSSPIIAEDETRQSPRDSVVAETPESQRPFKELSANSLARPSDDAPIPTSDQGAQTSLTADAIDAMFKTRTRPPFSPEKNFSVNSFGTPGTTGTVRIHRSQESLHSPVRNKGKMLDDSFDSSIVHRPGSSASAASWRISIQDAPALPSNHRQAIEAARTGSSHSTQRDMAPPLWPASALKARPSTPPQNDAFLSTRTASTSRPRAGHYDTNDAHSPAGLTAVSRKSSVSSFASELDSRFNMRPGEMGIGGFGPNTDPRMIQAITQTMIGEYLWKYTRKTGRGEMSGNRHRRYFWVHPYTRTLYWSDRDPSSAGRAEVKAKSVPIEAVRVVTDDNPMPPGLHRKSLVIIAPGRTIKFTCTTGQRHETWFNALSYLLLRTNNEVVSDPDETGASITREDVEEFNPQYGRRVTNGTPARVPPSLSSYNSRTTRNESPAIGVSMNVPTLTPKKPAQRPTAGTLSKISGYWKGSQLSGTFSTRRGRGPSAQDLSVYEASEAHDSAEDLRQMIERQDREAARLENVRACCDGKHDVGTLGHLSKRGRMHHHGHSHPTILSSTPMTSLRSRA